MDVYKYKGSYSRSDDSLKKDGDELNKLTFPIFEESILNTRLL